MDAHEAPLVSIVTPVLNGERYIETCLKGVLDQTYPNVEHIFMDAGSTDRTLDIIESYRRSYPDRIRCISEPDRGIGDAVTKGFNLARGEILGWIDTDDVYEPDAIETVVEFFNTNRSAMLVYGGCNEIDEDGRQFACFIIKDFDLREALEEWSYIVFCATFYRRQLIDAVGSFNDLGNDLDFWVRVDKHFRMHRIQKTLTNWRLHRESISMKRAAREHGIRHQRIREDFFIALRHGGSILAPRPARYYGVLAVQLAELLRPALGFSYPFLLRAFVRGVRLMDYLSSVSRRARDMGYCPIVTPALSRVVKTLDFARAGIRWTAGI